jgi:PEP-CTERM motif
MTFFTKFRLSALAVSALALSQISFAAPINSCVNVGSPVNGLVFITCNLYYNGSPNTFDLSGLMTQGGALLSANDFVDNYTVIINGNPSTLADNSTGLFNQSLWEAVLYTPGGDPNGPIFSDTLEVFWPGSFPPASTVQNFNATIFGSLPGFSDAAFFVQATGSETVIGAGTHDVLNIFTAPAAVPEPASFTLMATGILGLGLLVGMKHQRKPSLQ